MKTSNKLLLGFFIVGLIIITVFFVTITHYVNTLSAMDKFTKLPPEGKNINVGPFSAIKADGVYDIVLSQGAKESVTIKGDYSPMMKIYNKGNALILTDSLHVRFLSGTTTTVYITLVSINSLSIEGVCKTTCSDTLNLKNIVFDFPGVGSSNLLLNTDTLKISNEGTGSLTLAGKANYASISEDGTGSLRAEKFKVKELHVKLEGTGDAVLYASNSIYIEASGTGDVSYAGPAKVMELQSTGTGSVKYKE